jgi:glycerophosphoryl diester phosphodiesterase
VKKKTLVMVLSLTLPAATGTAADKLVIAHRGASGYLPEHTQEAIVLAHGMGAHYLEQDVVLSKDDVPIVLHDIHLDTVTDVARRFPGRARPDGRYYALDFTVAELKQLTAGERFDPRTGKAVFAGRFPAGTGTFRIPTLEEELQLIQGLNRTTGRVAGIYPEIKFPHWHRGQGRDISRAVLEVLGRYGYRTKSDPVYLQCFELDEVRRIRQELGYQGRLVQLLELHGQPLDPTDHQRLRTRAGLEEVAKLADGIGPHILLVMTGTGPADRKATDLVSMARALKLEVHPYTFRADQLPPYAATLEELFRLFLVDVGVDGMFTDHPDRGVAFLRSSTAR